MNNRRRIAIIATVACGAAAFAVPTASAGDAHHRHHGKRVILSPHKGKGYPARPVKIRVHTGHGSRKFRAQLNGHPIAQFFSRPSHRGVRRLEASLSHGLRHGQNRLHVRVGHRSQRTRFRIWRGQPLVGAGVDATVAAGDKAFVTGRLRAAGNGRSALRTGQSSGFEWSTVSTPPGAPLTAPGDATKRRTYIPTTVPGRYRVKLRAPGSGGKTVSDTVTVTADPAPTVPVDTMVVQGGGFNATRGIQVGGKLYQTNDSVSSNGQVWAQLVALDRKTLEPVGGKLADLANKSYACKPDPSTLCRDSQTELSQDLSRLGPDVLAIVSNPPPYSGACSSQDAIPRGLESALASIGVQPTGFDQQADSCSVGGISAIGSPGTKPGDADWNSETSVVDGGRMQGSLVRNNQNHYVFESYDRVDFDTQADGSTSSQNVIKVGNRTFTQSFDGGIGDGGGFQVVVVDAQTLQPSSSMPANGYWFETDHSDRGALIDQITAMRDLLQGVNAASPLHRKIVLITSLGSPAIQYYKRSGKNPDDVLNTDIAQLDHEVAQLGGTRGGFYKMIDPALYGSNGYSYTLFSESNSGPGQGEEEVGTGISGNGSGPLNTVPASGTLARTGANYGFDLEGALRTGPDPTGRDPSEASSELRHVAFQRTTPWPEEDPHVFPDAAERARKQAAIAWIGLHANPSGVDFPKTDDPRGQYWTLPYLKGQFDYNGWDKIAYAIQALMYPKTQAGSDCKTAGNPGFCPEDLDWAKQELAGPLTTPQQVGGEIGWLEATHRYLDAVATPFSDNYLKSWTKLQGIADAINNKVGAETSAHVAAQNWLALFDFARSVATDIPGIGTAFYVANDFYDLGSELTEINGRTVADEDDFATTVNKVGDALADRLGAEEGLLTRELPNAIAGDYGRLKTIGACASQDQANCPFGVQGWQYRQTDQANASQALLNGAQVWAYGQLLPAKYTLFHLPSWWRTKVDSQFHSRSLAKTYPFPHLPDTAQVAVPNYRNIPYYSHQTVADANLEWTITGGSDRWDLYVLGHLDRAGTTFDPWVMQYPEASVTDRLFGSPPSGLGVDAETFFDTQFDGPDQTQMLEHYPTKGTAIGWCELDLSCN